MTLSERTEQPMSESELAGIVDAHRKHRDTPSSYCMDCGHDWPCPTVRCVRALRSEREARRRVEAAAEEVAIKLERFAVARQRDVDANRDAPDNINEAVAAVCRGWAGVLRAALSSTEGTRGNE